MTIAPEAMDLIKSFEGYLKPLRDGTDRVRPYRCPAKVPTIGYGSIKYPGGRRVRMGDPPITHDRALELLSWEILQQSAPAVDRYVTIPLHPLMRGALVSFAFNCGTGALRRSTLLKRVNAERWEDVPKEFAKWRMGGGRVLRGLVRRRAAEAAMFMRGVQEMQNTAETAAEDDAATWPYVVTHEAPVPRLPQPGRTARPSLWNRLRRWIMGA